jgi:hypothetical protein
VLDKVFRSSLLLLGSWVIWKSSPPPVNKPTSTLLASTAFRSVQCASFPAWIAVVKADALKACGKSDSLQAVSDALDAVPDPSPPPVRCSTATPLLSAISTDPESDSVISRDAASESSLFPAGALLLSFCLAGIVACCCAKFYQGVERIVFSLPSQENHGRA